MSARILLAAQEESARQIAERPANGARSAYEWTGRFKEGRIEDSVREGPFTGLEGAGVLVFTVLVQCPRGIRQEGAS